MGIYGNCRYPYVTLMRPFHIIAKNWKLGKREAGRQALVIHFQTKKVALIALRFLISIHACNQFQLWKIRGK